MARKVNWIDAGKAFPENGAKVRVRTVNGDEVMARRICNGRWDVEHFDGYLAPHQVTHWQKNENDEAE